VPHEVQKVAVGIEADAPAAHVVFRRRVSPAPFNTQIATSDIVELVEVSAPGYKTERYWLTMDRATHLKAHLVKGTGLIEASEEDTLVALGEVTVPQVAAAEPTPAVAAAPASAAPAPAVQVASVEKRSAPAASPAPPRRKIGRAAADSPEASSAAPVAEAQPAIAAAPDVVPPAPAEAPAAVARAEPAPEPAAAPVPAAAVRGDVAKPEPVRVAAAQPAPAEAPHVVAPAVLKSLRISGGDQIDAPDLVQAQMVRDEHKSTSATLKVCVAPTGEISQVNVMKSSGYPAFDDRLVAGVHGWRYKAYVVSGRPVVACSAVTFLYKI
jgi:protein TonB